MNSTIDMLPPPPARTLERIRAADGLILDNARHPRWRPDLTRGAVATHDHLRMLDAQDRGVTFFLSPAVYDIEATKSLLSDYVYACAVPPLPVILTLSVCGSLEELRHLNVPRWMENALRHSPDPPAESYAHCLETARDLITFCRRLPLPFAFTIESPSASGTKPSLATDIRHLLH